MPTGITYCDRHRERNGDYVCCAHMPYATLALKIEPDCPVDLRTEIERHAATIQVRQGEPYTVTTSGQTVMLGTKRDALLTGAV